MRDTNWARGPEASQRVPDFDRPRSWKERPIDVRAEAASQVGSQRRGEVIARRIAEWREQREAAAADAAEASRCCPPCGPDAGEAAAEADRLRTPEVRQRRRHDPGYPSRWYLWRGDKGKAYVKAWESYSWGLSPRPKPWEEFRADPPKRRRLSFRRRGKR